MERLCKACQSYFSWLYKLHILTGNQPTEYPESYKVAHNSDQVSALFDFLLHIYKHIFILWWSFSVNYIELLGDACCPKCATNSPSQGFLAEKYTDNLVTSLLFSSGTMRNKACACFHLVAVFGVQCDSIVIKYVAYFSLSSIPVVIHAR